MTLNKKDLITIISLIYSTEQHYKEVEQVCIENVKDSDELVQEIKLLEGSKGNDGKEFLELKSRILQNNTGVKETLKRIKGFKNGKKTLYKWEFMSQGNLETTKNFVKDKELKEWLDFNFRNGQKIIYSNLNFKKIIAFLESNPKANKGIFEKYLNLVDKESTLYISSPLNLKGKETAYIYIKLDSDTEQVLKCKSTDVISANLLNISEDLDLSLLNTLKENNDLSLLYELVYQEASMANMRSEDENTLKELSEQLSKILRKGI
ncbi:hypothetical protein COL41_28905 [Bacillus mycoides]|uniref:hypothetical protein n=1 Tax=Bacillus mycoides TaxID=1405 RepID=UPI000BF8ECAD|nr:hypothetical protein [Bacillus mycoides]MED1381730.1 hypothetical protein [Bacillus mycoides]PFX89414.1 hypothetical protein COL41_28905 [Bacillus mycoides]